MKLRSKSFILMFILIAVLLCVFVACDKSVEGVTNDDDGECAIVSIDFTPVDPSTNSYTIEIAPEKYFMNLHERIEVSKGCTWNLYKDVNSSGLILQNKNTNLQYGDNIFYIIVTRGGESAKSAFYILNIYRNFYTDVKYYVNDKLYKTVPNVLSHTYFDEFDPIEVEGYTFNGWKYNNVVLQDGLYVDSQNIEVYATLKPNKYMLTLDADNGSEGQDVQVVDYGKSFKLQCPNKVGYKFVGWSYNDRLMTDSLGNSLEDFSIADNVTLKAIWEKNKYPVYIAKNIDVAGEIQMNDGAVCDFYDYQSTHTVTATTNPNYVFAGWYKDGNLIGVEPSLTFTVEDLQTVIMAKWSKVSFKPSGENMGEITTIESSRIAGGEATISVTTNLGYEFVGVYDGENLVCPASGQVIAITLPSEDKTYTAKWVVKDEMSNFEFSSSTDFCRINDVKDKNVFDVTIPDYVTELSMHAFGHCVNVESITIPSNVKIIGSMAFEGCSSLKTVVIHEGIETIDTGTFYECESLQSVTIPNSVTKIGIKAFYGCSALSEITIPNSVININREAFRKCEKLMSINIPYSVTLIGEGAFTNCSSLESIMVDAENQRYYSQNNCLIYKTTKTLMLGCKNSVIPDDRNIMSIGKMAFYHCTDLRNIVIPSSVVHIDDNAFTNCSNLTSVTMSNGNMVIGNYVFFGCENLASITIPDSVTSIGEHAFEGCTSLISATMPASAISAIPKTNLQTVEITSGESIGDSAFRNCKTLTSVTICDGVTSIEDYAFYGCSNLTSINIPGNVTNIGDRAFNGCENLVGVNVPYGVTSIGEGVFNGCFSLIEITIPNSVTSIGDNAFSHCYMLSNITLPEGITGIGNNAFASCNALTEIVIPNSVSKIGNYAFLRCVNLKSITLSNGVTTIGDRAFCFCSALTEMEIPNSVTEIGSCAFMQCLNLTSITLPIGITAINNGTFSACRSLTDIIIPNGVKSIGPTAFKDCKTLTSVTIHDGVTSIGDNAFFGCEKLTSIIIPQSATLIADTALASCELLTDVTYDGTIEEWKGLGVTIANCTIHCSDGDILPYGTIVSNQDTAA